MRFLIALLAMGSAISLFSCVEVQKAVEPSGVENLVSLRVDSMEVLSSENGQKSRLLRAPLMEEYAFAKAPFQEYKRGIEVIGYDSLGMQSSSVVADYALYWTERDFWELKGNVLVEGDEGQKLRTQQLMWDLKIKKFYSNVDSKVEDDSGTHYFRSFEGDDDFSRYSAQGHSGTMSVAVGSGSSPEPEAVPEPGSETEPASDPESESASVTDPKPEPGSESASVTDPKPEPGSESTPDPEPVADSITVSEL